MIAVERSSIQFPLHIPYISGDEISFIEDAIQRNNLKSSGYYTDLCEKEIKNLVSVPSAMMTTSCTHALEICAFLLDIQEGDEIIMSSFNFVSAANAFVIRGAKIVFIDIRPDTLNINEDLIEDAISPKTKAIVAMHYAAVACEMDKIIEIANKYNLFVIEDAAHCIDSYYGEKHLGSLGHLAAISFHSTKNIHCGEGGVLLINDERFKERAEIIREKGTNRKAFFEGRVDKYSWVDVGSSYILSELNAAFLYAQLKQLKAVTKHQRSIFMNYHRKLSNNFQTLPKTNKNNGHIFYIKAGSGNERNMLSSYLRDDGIDSSFHYVPLHSSMAGSKYSVFKGTDKYTTSESNRLLRIPLHMDISMETSDYIVDRIYSFSKC